MVYALILNEKTDLDPAQVVPQANFYDDLGFDSLDFVSLLMDVKDEFSIEIPDQDAEQLTTVQKLIDFISAELPTTTGHYPPNDLPIIPPTNPTNPGYPSNPGIPSNPGSGGGGTGSNISTECADNFNNLTFTYKGIKDDEIDIVAESTANKKVKHQKWFVTEVTFPGIFKNIFSMEKYTFQRANTSSPWYFGDISHHSMYSIGSSIGFVLTLSNDVIDVELKPHKNIAKALSIVKLQYVANISFGYKGCPLSKDYQGTGTVTWSTEDFSL